MSESLVVTFYTRAGCHLCEEVDDLLQQLQRDLGFMVRTIDISGDFDSYEHYHDKIPVVVVGSTQLHAPIHPVRLQAILTRATRGHLAGRA